VDHSPKTTWGAGDYPSMARRLMPAAEAAVAAAAIREGDRVVDVATGTGNAAVLAALCGARTTGVDFEPVLLGLAGQRAAEAALTIDWVLAEATSLPLPDGCTDVVLSVFGVMYAADHAAAATELSRICASGGRLVLAAWMPGALMPAMGQVLGGYLPPPPSGSGPPSRWGDPEAVETILTSAGLHVTSAVAHQLRLGFKDADAATALLIDTAGHVMAERDRLRAENRWDDLVAEVRAFVGRHGAVEAGRFVLRSDYLLVTAVSGAAAPAPAAAGAPTYAAR
jgi:SAM-dependent methyltransferase